MAKKRTPLRFKAVPPPTKQDLLDAMQMAADALDGAIDNYIITLASGTQDDINTARRGVLLALSALYQAEADLIVFPFTQ